MGVLARFSAPARSPRDIVRADDGLDAFLSEEDVRAGVTTPNGAPPTPEGASPWLLRGVIAVVVLLAAGLGGFALYSSQQSALASTGSVRVESNPAGATIKVDGSARGTTPATLSLPVGQHQLTLESGSRTRTINVDVVGNATAAHYIELPAEEVPAAAVTGGLQVTAPTTATVIVDGTPRGTTPLVLGGLTPGEHQVVVTAQGTTYRRTIQVDGNRTVSLVIGEMGGVAAGWMTARTPVPLTITENGQVVGTTASDRVMLPAGAHDFEFSSEALGYRTTRRVVIEAGRVASVALPLPQAPIQINALPWAEVWIDGQRIGETPIANVMQTIGPHEIVFRHPQLGEKRLTTVVTAGAPVRATVDMRTR